ncbi:MAG: arylamine N-acetyltransferase [Candidatus Marinimicrobia bacterium]|nr:arylamine N-acetyltransferase [Candidatus Neomarinimicrobiota bacterium]
MHKDLALTFNSQDRTTINNPLLDPSRYEHDVLFFLKEFKFDGERPSLHHIASVSRYFSRLPYENISKIIKNAESTQNQRLRLPDELTYDHFAWQAGGTCFSLTYFLCGIYGLLGYKVQPLICHLNWAENTHSAVVVQFAGTRYLVDPGYMIFKPLPLRKVNAESFISADTGISLKFDPQINEYALYTFRKGQFVRRYRFIDQDLSWGHFANYWEASFNMSGMDALTLARIEGDEMLYIQGDFVKVTSPDIIEKVREQNLAEKMIRDRFRIPLEKLDQARHILTQKQL